MFQRICCSVAKRVYSGLEGNDVAEYGRSS